MFTVRAAWFGLGHAVFSAIRHYVKVLGSVIFVGGFCQKIAKSGLGASYQLVSRSSFGKLFPSEGLAKMKAAVWQFYYVTHANAGQALRQIFWASEIVLSVVIAQPQQMVVGGVISNRLVRNGDIARFALGKSAHIRLQNHAAVAASVSGCSHSDSHSEWMAFFPTHPTTKLPTVKATMHRPPSSKHAS